MIEVEALTKVYPGGVRAVEAIDFTVDPGEVFGLLGPNGAGKSTTIGMLTTTLRPTSGTARLAGYDVAKQPLAARSVSSAVFQEAVVDRSLTGRRNLELHARLWNAGANQIDSTAAALGIADLLDRAVDTYSGGQRRRLEIARALVSDPRVLFLDEPTAGLDPRIRHELLDVLAGLRGRGELTLLLTTHYLDEAEQLCDRIAIMHLGRIVALDTPANLRTSLGAELVELRVDGDGERSLARLREHGLAGDDAFVVGSTLTVPLDGRGAAAAIAEIEVLDLPVTGVSTRRPTLDDIYLRLTGGRLAEAA
ncbi:MAG TPA: ATP-binding cassette domain-containing protein [Gaiellaceae bacterium]|nr:ATP-binding cassette domain-containing protein [Gaiellaceae bacterium]